MSIERVISPAAAFIMNSLLASVVTEGTAASPWRGAASPFRSAGKTGTTNNSRDAWFVGYTPELLALVWVGFDDGASIHASGPSAALPIWADLLKAIPQAVSGAWFSPPPGVVQRQGVPPIGPVGAESLPHPDDGILPGKTMRPRHPAPCIGAANPLRKFFDDSPKAACPTTKFSAARWRCLHGGALSRPPARSRMVARYTPTDRVAARPARPEIRASRSPHRTPRRPHPQQVAARQLTEEGRKLLAADRADDAITVLERALSLDAENGRNYYFLGEAWLQKGNFDQAREFNRLAELYLRGNPRWLQSVARQRGRIDAGGP